jgi:hypothetical protein
MTVTGSEVPTDRLRSSAHVDYIDSAMLDEARAALEKLVREATERVVTTEEALLEQRGAMAIYDSTRDAKFTELEAFDTAANAVATLPHFDERIGPESAERVTLQIVYEYFDRARHVALDADAFIQAVDGFAAELAKPTWTLVMVANLKYFESADRFIDFDDGMTIRARSFDELQRSLGWTDWHLESMTQDWMGFGASEHVIWFEEEVEKTPETLVLGNTATGQTRLSRLLLALWLHDEGDVNVGSVFNAESASLAFAEVGSRAPSPARPLATRHTRSPRLRLLKSVTFTTGSRVLMATPPCRPTCASPSEVSPLSTREAYINARIASSTP